MPHVVCAGVITVDHVFHVSEHPQRGQKHRAKATKMVVGGCALNAAAAIARLGGKVSLAGAVGDDMLGAFVRQELQRLGIGDRLLATLNDIPTAQSAVFVTPDGERTIVNSRDDRLFAQPLQMPGDLDFDSVLADTRWQAGAQVLLHAARTAGKPALVDAEAPLVGLDDTLELASHIAFSEQGLADFIGTADAAGLDAASRRLKTWVCVTRGPQSVLSHDGHRMEETPAFRVKAVDTLGAGDVWHGAFALALASQPPVASALRFANAVAALKTSNTGNLPTMDEVKIFLKENEQ
ncbi:PfkB family carbohydrate kinase [uncultured Hoeflea sp.]|uniref:PfkB family carbohydrate kinase n=1 Tax=uncultured Hoeflea sp. TaxID=538666 RepID=UPI0030D9A3E3